MKAIELVKSSSFGYPGTSQQWRWRWTARTYTHSARAGPPTVGVAGGGLATWRREGVHTQAMEVCWNNPHELGAPRHAQADSGWDLTTGAL